MQNKIKGLIFISMFLSQLVWTQDFSIRGHITTEYGQGIKGVELTVKTNFNSYQVQTDADGYYSLAVPHPITEVVEMEKPGSTLNGLSVLDMFLVERYQLGSIPLSSYQQVAADVNRSGSISTFDNIEISKLLLGINDDFPDAPNWRFIDKAYDFNADVPYIRDLRGPHVVFDVIGAKVGDASGNANPQSQFWTPTAESRNNPIQITAPDLSFFVGDEIRVPVSIQGVNEYLAIQMGIRYDETVLQFVGLEAGALDLSEASQPLGISEVTPGDLRLIHHADGPFSLEQSELFYLVFEVIADGQLAEVLSLEDDLLPTEYHYQDPQTHQLQMALPTLSFENLIDPTTVLAKHSIVVGPNPLISETWFLLPVPPSTKVIFNLYNNTGTLVKQIPFLGRKIELLRSGLSRGTYFYQIHSRDGTYDKSGKLLVF